MRLKIIVFLLGILFVLCSGSVSFAQEPSPSPTPVNYTLPYPGLLPGHPFLFLKEARDVIIGFFTSQPLKKAEFILLQADKNLQASYLLATNKNGKTSLVVATVTTAEDYFADAIAKMQAAKSQGIDTRDFTKTLIEANLKHQEVIGQVLVSARKEDKEKIRKQLERAAQFGKKLQSMLQK